MDKGNLKFVIVGHVDHGKSTLIGRLLFDTKSLPINKIKEIEKFSKDLGRETEFAFLLDHLQEEREQGITIDTTQIFFETTEREYVIIDAPGHREFVKNMITGASQAEAAVLIIDTEEGVQEQTKRHANILSMLGLRQVIVVLNKMDKAGYRQQVFNKIKDEAEKFLNSINIKPNYYIPISALKGDNIAEKSEKMSWYQDLTFLQALNSFKEKPCLEEKSLLFPIQDIYKINDKRIIVGKIEAGKIIQGQEILILPERKTTKIKTIEKFNESLESALAGENIGITTEDPLFIDRGNVICEIDKEPVLTDKFEANLFWMNKKDIKEGDKISLKIATQEVLAEIEEIKKRINSSSLEILEQDAKKLENLEIGEVIIKTKNPIAITKFNDIQELGRFVLMQDENICAGGIIV